MRSEDATAPPASKSNELFIEIERARIATVLLP